MAEVSMSSYFSHRVTTMQSNPDLNAYSTLQPNLDHVTARTTYRNGRAYRTVSSVKDWKLAVPMPGVLSRAVQIVRKVGELGDNYQ